MKDDHDPRLVAQMWATRRLLWLAWAALLLALIGLYENGISFVSVAVFVAAIALSIAIAMVEIEREQLANDARGQKFRDQQGDRGRVD
ncbi:hypothetical protein IVB30_36510 [Bradyrhizobium sp. 200]|uniref:hypothetical protein n=1 Tax=Bradyrhizobium sp. 200 TaxID=2782665 RepID=UPI001FFE5F79|nr:hypothetical protein [Bradyrhizobium sp. 200]UPJ48498.1 hypothetical protein IVB30_36510 [Bradyrhizobium sp. 200]